VCNEFGADAIRLYLINSPLVRADNLNFSKDGVKGVVREIFLPWYNAYRFCIQNVSGYEELSFTTFSL
jgi:isoleucyl-tRNA synthetase